MSALVTTDWLAAHLHDQNLIVLDASLPKPKAKPEDNPLNGLRIPGARFFDIDHVFSDTSSPLPHTMLTEEAFNLAAQQLGVSNDSRIVIYDNLGVYASPRAWWMFRAMGHKEVYVLDGGLPKWVAENRPAEKVASETHATGNFSGKLTDGYFVDASFVWEQTNKQAHLVLDARSSGRFYGTEPEPRPGLRGGHIPHSKSLPFPDVQNGHLMKSVEELRALFHALGVQDQPLTFSCGSGLTACILALAAHEAGYEKLRVYDGSWSEWGQENGLPVATHQ